MPEGWATLSEHRVGNAMVTVTTATEGFPRYAMLFSAANDQGIPTGKFLPIRIGRHPETHRLFMETSADEIFDALEAAQRSIEADIERRSDEFAAERERRDAKFTAPKVSAQAVRSPGKTAREREKRKTGKAERADLDRRQREAMRGKK